MEDLKREIRGRELANLFHPPPPSELPSLEIIAKKPGSTDTSLVTI